MLNVFMLNVLMLNVVMPSVVMLNVVAPVIKPSLMIGSDAVPYKSGAHAPALLANIRLGYNI
jgi:hypothetical protein